MFRQKKGSTLQDKNALTTTTASKPEVLGQRSAKGSTTNYDKIKGS
jgi:hypothetical protein